MTDIITISALLGIIVLLLIERHLSTEQFQKREAKLLEELSKAIKAVIAKNANEYVMTTSIDKVPSEEKPATVPDEVPEEALTDDQFFEAVGKSLKDEKGK